MANSYQVPQFLDSGDKIILGLNIRQFAYAMVGLLGGFVVFNIFGRQSAIVGLIMAAPGTLFMAFIAFGKFNGRDVELYIVKLLESRGKPKTITLKKQARTPLLDQRLTKLNFSTLNSNLEKSYAQQIKLSEKQAEFRNLPIAAKINRIKNVSQELDVTPVQEYGSLYISEVQNKKIDDEYKLGETSIYNKIFSFGPQLANRPKRVLPSTTPDPISPSPRI